MRTAEHFVPDFDRIRWIGRRDRGRLDYRSAEHIYVQRIRADGSLAPGWPFNGVPATLAQRYQNSFVMIADGASGAFLAWEDTRNNDVTGQLDIYAQHVIADGTIAVGWPADGQPVCVSPSGKGGPSLVADGTGGIVVAWTDVRTGTRTIFAQHLLADGSVAPGWAPNGVSESPGRALGLVVGDSAGGFYLFSATLDPIYPGYDEFDLQRLTFAGTTVSGWPTSGIKVCVAPDYRVPTGVLADGFGGVMISWEDYRPSGRGIFALRVQPSGALAAGWTPNGRLVTDPNTPDYPYGGTLARDGSGGAYVLWIQDTPGGQHPAYIQHLTANGAVAPGWLPFGARVAPSIDQSDANMTADGQSGVIVSWSEGCCGRIGVWAQRFAVDGPVAVELSLVSAEAKDGFVELDWFNAGTALGDATVSRRTESSTWTVLGNSTADGTGHLRYEDRNVSPGTRYAYRLGYVEGGVERFTTEAWVDVPALALALGGLRPNPATGPLTVSFALPTSDPASLEVLDVSGRRLMQREVGSMGAGAHVVRLDEGRSLASGIYWLRLRQGAHALLTRGAVVR